MTVTLITGANKGIGFVQLDAALPLLRKSANPHVVTVSSSAGSPEERAAVVVRLATQGPEGPTGTLRDENGELHF